MSGISIVGYGVAGMRLATGLGELLALDPAEAAARNARIRQLTEERRSRRAALEAAEARAADERERLTQRLVRARVEAAGAAAALAAAGLPPDPGLEPPIPCPAAEQWCAAVPALVRAAHARAGAAIAAQAVPRLAALLAAHPAGPLVSAVDLLRPDEPGPAPGSGSDAVAVLARMLATLDARADAGDRDLVEEAAEAAAQRTDRAAHLVELRLRIQEANDRVGRRHDDAVTAAQLLDAMEPYRPEHGLDPDRLGDARGALDEVVAGRRELDDALLDLVAKLRGQVEARASAATVTDAVADVLGELGYLVGPDFSVGEATEGMLEVCHPAQPEHLIRMRVDAEQRQLVAMVYRAGAGAEDAEADAAAEAAWCGDLDRAVTQLAGSGMELTPVVLTAPGARPVAVVAAEAEGRSTTRQRHHTHQRAE
ncbi:hypothetical protein ONA91_08205 [Micromonospora sp. DR5-3]|uniref:hypothetical protein n=1 Tax=unclassified Micromonospora TaxID=2617518 RepID=UPI0011DB1673|nr:MULTISPECIES: hypothetical protein [unclassified Micromonospora]MCW3814439.1 hypothetical protein [Micromonospora sp. DR5-3]TYC22663.1 hypothetical protein FXF52_19285 [Micromonospora sp. MP36]